MHHYVYLLEFENGKGYIGSHSTNIEPELDTRYLGSGAKLPKRNPNTCKKTIIKICNSRQDAQDYEEKMIRLNNCVESGMFYNMRYRVNDKHGSHLSDEHKEQIRNTQLGRCKHSSDASRLTGDERTPAQKQADTVRSVKQTGILNKAKGHTGVSNCAFKPWYYITPNGVYHEMHNETKEDAAARLGFTIRQLTHGFHRSNEHKKARTLPRKGWTFGNLPRPTDLVQD